VVLFEKGKPVCNKVGLEPMQKGSMGGLRESDRKPEKSAPHAITMLNNPSRAGWISGANEGKTSGVTNLPLTVHMGHNAEKAGQVLASPHECNAGLWLRDEFRVLARSLSTD
jgi:hypothetical protein